MMSAHPMRVALSRMALALAALLALVAPLRAEGVASPDVSPLIRSADLGDADACYTLGTLYAEGTSVSQDWTESIGWFALAAERGHQGARAGFERVYLSMAETGDPDKCYDLGVMYRSGGLISQDHAQARIWLELAADQGHADAQTLLGDMLFSGDGVSQDRSEAAKWYRKAADQRHVDARLKLGLMYMHGSGIVSSDREAAGWFAKAAEQGSAAAQLLLAMMYADGRSVEREPEAAYIWAYISYMTDRNGDARDMLEALNDELSFEIRLRAEMDAHKRYGQIMRRQKR